MALPWVRLDTQFANNPKVLHLVEARKYRALVMYVCGLGYAGAHQTDGFIPKAALPFLHGTKADATELVMSRLWHCTEGGWGVNDWDEYQETKAVAQQRWSNKKSAGKKAACARWHKDGCECWRD